MLRIQAVALVPEELAQHGDQGHDQKADEDSPGKTPIGHRELGHLSVGERVVPGERER
jgi:hypothetical protein